MAINPAYDITYWLSDVDILTFEPELFGTLQSVSFSDNVLDFDIILEGTWQQAQVFDGLIGVFDLTLDADIYIDFPKGNWVKWSKIGQFDFTIDRSNLAGEMPIGWKGEVYRIGKLGGAVMVYGSGGVTKLQPSDNVFGKLHLVKKGVMSKGAVLLLDSYHLMIDTNGCLWRLSEKVEKLGYEEYLSLLNSPTIHYDEIQDLVYICDGVRGFVFNSDENSMGQGPINLTGIGYHEGDSYFLASSTLTSLGFQIGIDTSDLGNRNFKTIHEVEIGIDSTSTFQLGISFKTGIAPTFIGPVWFDVTPEGRCFPNCWGKDHRFFLKTTAPDAFKLSYIKIEGQIADFNPLDMGA
jgi:hypothetical protein